MVEGKRGVVERTRCYLTSPSTHVGFYMAGVGSAVGGTGGLLKGVADELLVCGPAIADGIANGSWQEVLYHTGMAVGNVLATSAYVTAAGAFVGYMGGTLVTDRAFGYVSSFFSFFESVFRGSKKS